ncbi:hypothetical protein [Cryobacterium sp. M25]|uniref:hypothetical protein n=1 Tax=Cryobacterium sp. M25 TaxID=2048293 RepID=UPI0011B062B7|nr:hypothetical protein [Cryobacterium sp. M25]
MIREDISAGHRRLTGIYNAGGSEHGLSTFLLTTAEVAGHIGQLLSADDDWPISGLTQDEVVLLLGEISG